MYDIEKELALYKLRNAEIKDKELMIQEIKLGDNFAPISYESRVQTTSKGTGAEKDLETIDRLRREIKRMKIANKRVDIILSILREDREEFVRKYKIEKYSNSKIERMYDISESTRKKWWKDSLRDMNKFIENSCYFDTSKKRPKIVDLVTDINP